MGFGVISDCDVPAVTAVVHLRGRMKASPSMLVSRLVDTTSTVDKIATYAINAVSTQEFSA